MDIYVLQVITGKEIEARKLLQSLMLTSGGRIIFPRRELMQRKGGRQYKKVQPLFPGYLFWETPELGDDIIHKA
ncbi:MAG: hypothetical protein KAJ98_07625, partial [Spirochaetaceae bacterium]|nr:hypothetical protein [Spirochaetaceae bacterium]